MVAVIRLRQYSENNTTTQIVVPISQNAFNLFNRREQVIDLPYVWQESTWMQLWDWVAVLIGTSMSVLILVVHFNATDWSDASIGLFGSMICFLVALRHANVIRIRMLKGPAQIILTENGLEIPWAYEGVLPWKDIRKIIHLRASSVHILAIDQKQFSLSGNNALDIPIWDKYRPIQFNLIYFPDVYQNVKIIVATHQVLAGD
jgi:hypothetical protein